MARFVVRERERAVTGGPQFLVVDSEDEHRPVAEFDRREDAAAHADRLNLGPLDWDEQEAWKDDWGDEDDDPARDGGG